MTNKLANELIHSNEEFEKLKSSHPDDVTPRETPDHQSSGYRGLQKPALEQWTTTELREMAEVLAIGQAERMSRDDLIKAMAKSSHRGDRR